MDPKPEWHCRIGRVTRKGGATVRVLRPPEPRQAAVDLAEQALANVKSGKTVALAVVEVHPGGRVSTGWSDGPYYHRLNSGAATLATRLAI